MVDSEAPTSSVQETTLAPKASRVWWMVHQWVGLKLSIFLSFILLTGTIAVLSHEIDWLISPAFRVDPSTVEGPVNWPAIAQTAASAHPDGQISHLYGPLDPWFAASAVVAAADGGRRLVIAHPTTGDLRAERSIVTTQLIMRRLHRHLFLPNKIGILIVSSLSILLAVSLITSFIVYKKWWRGFFRPLRTRDARTWTGDFHRLAGLWTLWFTFLMVLTGFWYLVETLGGNAPSMPSARVEAARLTITETSSRLADSLSTVRTANPDLIIERVIFPTERNGAFVFQGQDSAILVRPRANAVWTYAATADVVLITDARDLNIHQRISEMADPLHFGYFGGIWTKLIWFLFGLLMTGLALSGAAIYALRLTKANRQTPSISRVTALSLKGMGPWKWLATTLLAVGAVFLTITLRSML